MSDVVVEVILKYARFAKRNFAVLAVVLPVLLAMINIVSISGGDPEVAAVIALSANIKTIVLGSALASLPVLAFPVAFFLLILSVIRFIEARKEGGGNRIGVVVGLSLVSLYSLLYAPFVISGCGMFGVLLGLIVGVLSSKSAGYDPASSSGQWHDDAHLELIVKRIFSLVPALWIVVVFTIIASSPAFPEEWVQLRGQNSRLAIQIASDAASETLQFYSTTDIVRVSRSSVASEEFCDNFRFWQISPQTLIDRAGDSALPWC